MSGSGFRTSTQSLAPGRGPSGVPGTYNLHPTHPLPRGAVGSGFADLAAALPGRGVVALDGYAGVLWSNLRNDLDAALRARGVAAHWIDAADALLPNDALEARLAPFLGAGDPLFGTRFTGGLADFFDPTRLRQPLPPPAAPAELVVIYGCGAALFLPPAAFLVYVDLPKNELQFRARAGLPTNLGCPRALPPKAAYKRSYFVDWPALNRHKQELAARVDLVVDAQRPADPTFIAGDDLRAALEQCAHRWFRVRPWFEPGPWGGQWCRRHIPELPPAPNYAWSFELITPENGLTFRDADDRRIEVSFDWLMFQHGARVLGDSADWFGTEFPIRFDFLDTVEGGNLSVQVHPGPDTIRREFGERFTQDETYYILDAAPGATVNLGFADGVDPATFKAALERSFREAQPLDVSRYVQSLPARKHDLFLIPHGTVHGAGIGNLVLEISATPYIFTFKLYDWLRPDLDGRPRPLNLERGMGSLDFSRAGARVVEELVAQPRVVAECAGWTLEHLPTHPDHFYTVYRCRLHDDVEFYTDGSPHILSLVEGSAVRLELDGDPGESPTFRYAETFVIPAATGRYRLRRTDRSPAEDCVIIIARMKPRNAWPAWMRP